MATQPSQRPSCTKRGVILTCYLNGRKRFRAVPVDAERDPAPPTLSPCDMRPAGATNVSWMLGSTSLGF